MQKLVGVSLLMLPIAPGQTALTTAQIAKRIAPSVVVIQGKTDSGDAVGSGFVVSKDGKIATNLHVIRDLNSAVIQLSDGRRFNSVSVLATDEQHDLAIIRIADAALRGLPLSSEPPTVGEPVVVIGTPRGLEGTVTAGVLSAIRDGGEGYNVLQTDAAINPGNSGGPLVNSRGQVIGVVSFKLQSSERLGFAIPISYVNSLLSRVHQPIPLAQLRSNTAQIANNQGEIVSELSIAKMRSILQGMGFDFSEQPNGNGNPILNFQLDGYRVSLLTLADNLMLYSGFTIKVDLSRVNRWNQEQRFSRTYLDKDGDPAIESDLDVSGGVTKETIERFIKRFRTTLSAYVKSLTTESTQAQATPVAPVHRRSAAATTSVKLPFGDFTIWVDETKWKRAKSDDGSIVQFDNVNTEGYARIITERISVPIDNLGEIALINLKKVDPNAKISFQERRIVNGRQVLAMYIDATVSALSVRYYGYYYGGSSGTIQAITYTVSDRFAANVDEFTKFLDGLEITDQELPASSATLNPTPSGTRSTPEASPGLLVVNNGSMGIRYDPKKWKQKESKEPGHFLFDHAKGDRYAMVIAERISVPTDSLPDIALSNAREADPMRE